MMSRSAISKVIFKSMILQGSPARCVQMVCPVNMTEAVAETPLLRTSTHDSNFETRSLRRTYYIKLVKSHLETM